MATLGYHMVAAAALAATLAVPSGVRATRTAKDRGQAATEKLRAQREHPVTALELSSQGIRALHRHDIYEIGDLVPLGEADLLSKSGLGPASVGHIRDALPDVGLSLDMEVPPEAAAQRKKSTSRDRRDRPGYSDEQKQRTRLIDMVKAYATALTPKERERILQLHREALVDSCDDPELGERRFEVLMAQWVHLEDRQPLANLGKTILKRTKDGNLVTGLTEAHVGELEHGGLYRLGVALNREALRQGVPINDTWQRTAVTAKPPRDDEHLTPAVKRYRARIQHVLDQPKALLHLGLPSYVPKHIRSIGEVVKWMQDTPGQLTQKQRMRAQKILSAIDLSEIGLEGVRMGLDMDVSWWQPRKRSRVASGLSQEDIAESIRPLTSEEIKDLTRRFAAQIGNARGIRFLRLRGKGLKYKEIIAAECEHISPERVRQILSKTRWELQRWRDRQSVVPRALRLRPKTSNKHQRKGPNKAY